MTAVLWTDETEAQLRAASVSRQSSGGSCLTGAAQPPALLRSVLELLGLSRAWGGARGRNVAASVPPGRDNNSTAADAAPTREK